MFGKWKKRASHIREEPARKNQQKLEQPKLEEYKFYNWSRQASDSINLWTLALLCLASTVAICHLSFYWYYNLWGIFWLNTAVCVIAEMLTVCWAMYWWKYLSLRLITARGKPRISKFNIGTVALITPLYAVNVACSMRVNPDTAGTMVFLLLWFGGFIAMRFMMVWSEYRKSIYYRKTTFIDYCNMPL